MGCAASMPSATLELSDRLTSGQHCCTSGRSHQVDRELSRSSSGGGGWGKAAGGSGGMAVYAECAPGEAGRAARLRQHQAEWRHYVRASRELHRDSLAAATHPSSPGQQAAPARSERHCLEPRSPFQDMLFAKVAPDQEPGVTQPWPPPQQQQQQQPPVASTPQKRHCEGEELQAQRADGALQAQLPLMRGDSAASVPICLEYVARCAEKAPQAAHQQQAQQQQQQGACLPALRARFSGDSASSPQHQQEGQPAAAPPCYSFTPPPEERAPQDSAACEAAPSPFGSVLQAWQPRQAQQQPQSVFGFGGAAAAGSPFGSGTATASPFGSQTLLTSRQPLPPMPNPFGAGCGSGSGAAGGFADSAMLARPLGGSGFCDSLLAPPPPPEQDVRMCSPRAGLDGVNLRKELHIEPLLQLVCTVLQCDVAVLTLAAGDQMLVMRKGRLESREETEAGPLWQHRGALPIPTCCAALVLPDASADHRLPAELWERMGLGFFCAKPLCSGAARRSGTLCLGTAAPRSFGPGPLGILANLCELVVHEIEAAAERAEQRAQSEKLLAAMDLYQEAFLLVDTTVPHWRILHLNIMAANEIEMAREDAKDSVFWDVFEVRDPASGELAQPWVPCEAAAAKGQKFVLHKVRRAGAAEDKLFVMRFRPACQEMQPTGAIGCGLPIAAAGRPFYFVEVSEAPVQAPSPRRSLEAGLHHGGAGCHLPQVHTPKGVLSLMRAGSAASACCESPMMMDPATNVPFPGLELGFVLGRGAFGSVFRGTYNGEPVAVKIIVDNDQARVKDGLPVEAHITAGLNHVNVVRTIAHAWRPLSAHVTAGMSVWDSADSAAGIASEGETWLLLELCDRGTLQDAILNHFFKEVEPPCDEPACSGDESPARDGAPSPASGQLLAARAGSAEGAGRPPLVRGGSPGGAPRMEAILRTALEVAEGMGYLHARGIVHGDLTGANILLQSALRAPHGITAKVADFGLSREMHCRSRVETRTCGTITHMPPELLSSDVVSKAADVYAFGVLLWELFHGTRAWEGYNHAQVIHAVAIMKASLEFQLGAPAPYLRLAQGCMAADPKQRPCFVDVTHALRLMLAAVGQDPDSQLE